MFTSTLPCNIWIFYEKLSAKEGEMIIWPVYGVTLSDPIAFHIILCGTRMNTFELIY